MRIPAGVTLALTLAWVAVVFGLRPWLQRRRTGDAGFRRLSGSPGTAAWWGGVLFASAISLGVAAPVAALAGLPPLPGAERPVTGLVGLGLAAAGWIGTLAGQAAMGDGWRVGVDAGEQLDLVTTKAFRHVRNPFFAATLVTSAGLALMTPNALAAVAVCLLLAAIEIQVRAVEEPYLLARHGEAYRAYCARTGRFVPTGAFRRRTAVTSTAGGGPCEPAGERRAASGRGRPDPRGGRGPAGPA